MTTQAPGDVATANSRLMLYFSAIGLFEGLAWGWLTNEIELVASEYWKAGLVAGISSVALGARLGWEHIARHRFWFGLAGLALVSMLGTAYVWSQLPVQKSDYLGDSERLSSWCFMGGMAALATLPFLQMAFSSEPFRQRFAYARWFDWSWRNVTATGIAGVFTGVATAIYFLWLLLLDFIGLARLSGMLGENPMPSAVIGTAFGYGLVLTRIQTRFASSLRDIVTSAATALLVVIGFFVVMVLASLPFTGMEPLWSTNHATPILLSLTILFAWALALTRGEDRTPPYPAWLRHGVEVAVALLPAFPGLAIYSTWLRIDQYGLTPDRVWALTASILLSLYTLGIALSLVRRQKPWLYLAGYVNLALAAASIPVVAAMHTPWLDPMRLSANSQVQRVLSGHIAITALDIETIRNRWGRVGWEKVEELRHIEDHPLADDIRDHVDGFLTAVSAGRPWSSDATLVGPEHVELSRPDMEVPNGVWRAIGESSSWLQHCRQERVRCLIFEADIATFRTDSITGPKKEYCVLLDSWSRYQTDQSLCYGFAEGGRWRIFGRLIIPEDMQLGEFKKVLAERGPRIEEPLYRRLNFGEHTVDVVPCCDQMSERWRSRR